MVDVALKHHRARLQGKPSPDPYLKVWDAQSQVSAALSWDAGSAELWLEAGNLTLTLAGLMRAINEGDLLHDCLGYWAHALELEAAASAGGQRPLASRLRGWLKQLAAAPEPEMKTSVRTRVLLQVRGDAWKAVQRWAKDPPLARGIPQRKMGRVERQIGLISAQAEKGLDDTCTQASTDDGCDARGPGAAPRPRQGGDWLGAKLGEGKQLVFPTTIYRTNLRQELGAALFHKLSTVAAAKYSEYSEKMRKKSATITEYDINNRFFSFQEVNEHAFSNPRVVKKWPELYGTDEFKTILRLARNASLAYFNHSGIDVEGAALHVGAGGSCGPRSTRKTLLFRDATGGTRTRSQS
ncbi:unnamed protein product [Prorocentrum cordatum]|uniref:Uncharacterized protein n=1 Tax=Prorocentrum cordatum TaxID=2364126 RepID=A0ABN9VUB2_9DINO|nr:unnamed protein product [Polarella glacialis]